MAVVEVSLASKIQKMKGIVGWFSLIVCLSGCVRKDCNTIESVEQASSSLHIERFDQELAQLGDSAAIIRFIEAQPRFAEKFLQVYAYPDRGLLYNQLLELNRDPFLDTLKKQTYAAFPTTETLEKHLRRLFGYLKYFDPKVIIPQTVTVITGFGTDLFYSDSLLVISLDYFSTHSGKYKPDMPQYILDRYYPESVQAIVALLVSNKYNQINELDQSLIAEMVYYGKAYYFARQLLPCVHDTIVTGFTQQEISILESTGKDIWAYLVEKEHLFSTEHRIVNKYVGERPYIAEIGPSCPGRAGRWLGLKIVEAYMKRNPTVGLLELMADPDAKKLFLDSKYKP